MNEPTDKKRKKILHDFAKWTALSALRSGSPLKRAERVYDLRNTLLARRRKNGTYSNRKGK